jgi:nucleoside-diphosphate-sugar epimerase
VRVLITGAGGFIGHHLVADQLQRGHQVTALDLKLERLESFAANARLRRLQGDFSDHRIIEQALQGQDVCFHLASAHLETTVGESRFWRTNVDGARDLVEQAARAGVGRVVHCSSVGVYGDLQNPPADEGTECHPDIAYERTKLAGERAVRAVAERTGNRVVILRPAWVYGPGCPRTLKLFRSIHKGRFFYVGSGQTLRHPIHIDDLLVGLEMAAHHEAAPGQVFILAGPRAVTLRELVNEIAGCLGKPAPRIQLPYGFVWPACALLEWMFGVAGKEAPFSRRSLKFFTGNTAFCTRKAAESLAFRARIDLREGLSLTYQALAGQL